ncbi:cyclin-L1-like isoform X2 [Melanaphis sacchari]|uniref:cyclin-L1-like isoform X2 n=1 Tax=Melanaphis sacchari TaxID=742174 RepID=UPI000DC12EF8|nr:cyclin-L1-like isoform X2 [Melanaphis sacchari]
MCKMETMTMTCSDVTNDHHVLKQPTKVLLTLSNVLLPKEKLTSTPSMIDGLDFETEVDLRIVGCEWIQTAGMLLKLPQVAMATGQVLFQRFYYTKSFVRHPMEITAMACTCLASKVEESPRRIRDVINVYHHIRQVLNQKLISPLVLDQNYVQKKMQALGFEKHQSIMQMSWNYMNDSLQTDVFVQFYPETIACACIYLSARKLKIPLPKRPAWYSLFNSNETDIQDICRKILKLYLRPKVITEDLEKRVEESKKEYDHAKKKAKEAIVRSVVQTKAIMPNSNNGITAAIPENISLTTSNKKPIKKRSRSITPLKIKSRSKSPRYLKKSKKRKLVPTYRDYKEYKDYKNCRDYKDYKDYRGNENYKSKSRNYNYRKRY